MLDKANYMEDGNYFEIHSLSGGTFKIRRNDKGFTLEANRKYAFEVSDNELSALMEWLDDRGVQVNS